MRTTQRLPTIRSTLKHILKEALQCRARSSTAKIPSSTSGNPRGIPLDTPCLPQLSQVSLFPDFESDWFRDDNYCISPAGTVESLYSRLQSTNSEVTLSLLPATQLSKADLYGLYTNHAAFPQRQVQFETVPDMLMEGSSQHASISTMSFKPSLGPRSSTLRIARSEPSVSTESQNPVATDTSLPSMSSLRKSTGSRDLRRNPFTTSFTSRLACPPNSRILSAPAPTDSFESSTRPNASILSIKHFKSFCVLDTYVFGCPVTAASGDLRYIFHIGDKFVLNIQECEGTSIDIVTGSSPDGKEVVHLVLFSPLLTPSTGLSRFALAALVDVTDFVHEASQLQDRNTTAEEPLSDDGILLPANTLPRSSWPRRTYELLPEDLLGGCSVTAEPQRRVANGGSSSPQRPHSSSTGTKWESEDIWLALARQERLEKDWQHWAKPSNGESIYYSTPESMRIKSTRMSKSSTIVDEILEEFMMSLQRLYSESFLLARSPLDDKYYEICNVSPAVYASGEHVTGHLTHTALSVIEGMSERLGAREPFKLTVRWGSNGVEKCLYCVPLYGQSSITWICVLVDLHMPDLW